MRFQTPYLVTESPLIKDVNVLTWERVESPWLHSTKVQGYKHESVQNLKNNLQTVNNKQQTI